MLHAHAKYCIFNHYDTHRRLQHARTTGYSTAYPARASLQRNLRSQKSSASTWKISMAPNSTISARATRLQVCVCVWCMSTDMYSDLHCGVVRAQPTYITLPLDTRMTTSGLCWSLLPKSPTSNNDRAQFRMAKQTNDKFVKYFHTHRDTHTHTYVYREPYFELQYRRMISCCNIFTNTHTHTHTHTHIYILSPISNGKIDER